MINWGELFEEENTVFHCETKEIANYLTNKAHDLGYKWCNDYLYTEKCYWDSYKEETCYEIKHGEYTKIDYYIGSRYTIINVRELLESEKPKLLRRR
jgi:hypothetical protein